MTYDSGTGRVGYRCADVFLIWIRPIQPNPAVLGPHRRPHARPALHGLRPVLPPVGLSQIPTGEASLFATELERVDNITDTALLAFREHYADDEITKDAIFDYVYGVLHAPAYRERFANDLSKVLPRVPMAPDFGAFAEAGRDLAALHLGYETCDEYPLEIVAVQLGGLESRHFCLGERAMRFADDDRTVLIVNDNVRVAGIPPQAHGYIVNGRTPLDWLIDRYRVKRDRDSGIVNDPNGWFAKPEDLIAAIRRIVHVSVETARIVASLPGPFAD